MLNNEQKVLMARSFERIMANPDVAGGLFYSRLFGLQPRLKLLFKGDVQAQRRKLIEMLDIAVRGLDRWEQTRPFIEQSARHHFEEYGVKPADFAPVEEALVWMAEGCLGSAFDGPTRVAWHEFYTLLADTMLKVA